MHVRSALAEYEQRESRVSRFNPHPAARLCPPPATANTRTGFIDGSSAEMNDFANLDV